MRAVEGATIDRRDILLILSEELDDLSASATSLQATLGALLDRVGPEAATQEMWHLQEIDRLHQTLDDLAAILRRTAEDDGPRVDVEGLASVARLGALKERLRGNEATGIRQAGIVAMF